LRFFFIFACANLFIMDKTKPVKLHLGCGETYLEGYVNIDFPKEEHTIATAKADRYVDLRTLRYPKESIEEIRNHHVLEHFDRVQALVLLMRWHEWLVPGGTLVVETPDFEGCAEDFIASKDLREKSVLLRHVFGSHEAQWALHYDGWFEEKYRFVLEKLGFTVREVVRTKNNLSKRAGYKGAKPLDAIASFLPQSIRDSVGINTLPNILCIAEKREKAVDHSATARDILSFYLVGKEKKNMAILNVWMGEFETLWNKQHEI